MIRRMAAALLALLVSCAGVLGGGVVTASADPDPMFSVVETVSVGAGPFGVAVSPGGGLLYVTNDDDSMNLISTATNTVVATVPVGSGPSGVAASPDGLRVYVANSDEDSVSVFDSFFFIELATVPVGDNPGFVAVTPDGSRVYVVNSNDGTVSVISTATNTVVATVPVGIAPTGVVVSRDGSRVYVANSDSDTVSVIATATNTVSATVSVGRIPYGVAVSPDGSRVYVPSFFDSSVSVISTATNTVSDTLSVGPLPVSVAVSPDGSLVYVTQYLGSVSVISTATNTVSDTLSVGSGAINVTVSPNGSRVYVVNLFDSSVSVISAPASVTAPAAPTSLSATVGNGSASIAFTAGADGGAAITKYQYRVGSGAWTDAVGTSSPITVTGLTNGIASSVRLRAVNSVGAGAASSPVSVTPRQAGPSAPVAATPSGISGFVVTFTLNPLPGTTVAYQSATVYLRGTNTVAGSCRTYSRQTTCYIGGLTRATNYDLRVTAYLPVAGKTWHIATAEGSILPVRTNN